MTDALTILHKASEAVGGDRAINHGDMVATHQAIAAVWNGILAAAGKSAAQPLDAYDVANMMEGLKIARRYHGAFNVDDHIDGAGYAACAGAIRSSASFATRTLSDALMTRTT